MLQQVEIDEYQNYEKALGALTEALRCLERAGEQERQQQLRGNMDNIKEFVSIQVTCRYLDREQIIFKEESD